MLKQLESFLSVILRFKSASLFLIRGTTVTVHDDPMHTINNILMISTDTYCSHQQVRHLYWKKCRPSCSSGYHVSLITSRHAWPFLLFMRQLLALCAYSMLPSLYVFSFIIQFFVAHTDKLVDLKWSPIKCHAFTNNKH